MTAKKKRKRPRRKSRRTMPLLRKLHEVQTYNDDIGGFMTYSISTDKKSADAFKRELEKSGYRTRIVERK